MQMTQFKSPHFVQGGAPELIRGLHVKSRTLKTHTSTRISLILNPPQPIRY
jgi:hypothetical protein